MFPALALPAAFFLSGAAGLMFQMVWFYRSGLVFGSSVAAVAVVLSGFMAGLASGSLLAVRLDSRTDRPLRLYAALELVVGMSGLLVTYLLPHVGAALVPLARTLAESSSGINLARFVLAFALLVLPASAMGATLPLVSAALVRTGSQFGIALGRLYGWNTLGAVAGVVFAEVVLIRAVGVAGTAWVAAALNASAAALAMWVAAPWLEHVTAVVHDEGGMRTPAAGAHALLLVTAGLCGAALLALEVIWFRFLSMYVLVTTLAMSVMLATVLAGIALGGLTAAWWSRRREDPTAVLPVAASLSGMCVVASYAAFHVVTAGTQVGAWPSVLWFACVLTLPTSWLSGILFTLIGDALYRRTGSDVASVSRLAAANTAGAIAGPPIAAWLLIPRFGMEGAFLSLAIAYALIAAMTVLHTHKTDAIPTRTAAAPRTRRGWSHTWTTSVASIAVLVIGLALFPFGSMADRYFPRAAAAYSDDGSRIVATREGPGETLFVLQQQWLGKPVYSRLITNGFSMSGTALQGQRYMRAFAYYPMLLHDGPMKKALVICYGVGVTVGAVTHIPSVEAIDVVEISKDVVAMSDAIYQPESRPLSDPRVRLRIEDGRFFLQTTGERFDLITGEPPPPRTPGTVNIYTRDYFSLVRDRLADGGIATYWVPVARPNPGTDVNTIIRAFCEVFEDCSLWNATPFDLMLVGSRGLKGPRTMTAFSAPWQTPGLEARLREVGFERPEQIGATFVGDSSFLNSLTAPVPSLTDDFPQRLQPVSGRPSLSDPLYGVDSAVTAMYRYVVDSSRARDAFSSSPFIAAMWPAELIARTLPFFDVQGVINRVYWEGSRPLRQIDDLDTILTKTTLRTLPLWLLGSDEVKQQIAETASASNPDARGAIEYARGLRGLTGRDYAGAAQWLTAAEQRGIEGPTVRALRAYAHARSGALDQASRLMDEAKPADDEERGFWEWLREGIAASRFGAAP
jgi:predicted membrane-bound spermidine synthase